MTSNNAAPRTIMRATDTGWNVHNAGRMVGTITRTDGGYAFTTSLGSGLGCCGWNTNRRAAADRLVRYYNDAA